MRHRLWLVLIAGCAPPRAEAPPPWVSDDDPPAVQASDDAYLADPPRARIMHAPLPPESRWETQTIATQEPAPPRPVRVGRRDIRLHNARLDNALRMLAQAGRFNLVVKGDLAAPVTVDLARVEPYDALLAIAEAHGVRVQYRDDIVVVTAPP